MEIKDLFVLAEEPGRAALCGAGAAPADAVPPSGRWWRLPAGMLLTEPEALAWLGRRPAAEEVTRG